MDNLTSK